MDLKKDKRGMSIGEIYPIMLTIGLVAILIAIILFVLLSFNEQISTDDYAVINESGAWVNSSGYTLDNADFCGFNTPVIIAVWANVSRTVPVPYLIPFANYSISESGVLTNATVVRNATEYEDANVSYTYKGGETACEAIEDVQVAIADFVPWIGIILLIVAAAIVLGILIRNLAGGSSRV